MIIDFEIVIITNRFSYYLVIMSYKYMYKFVKLYLDVGVVSMYNFNKNENTSQFLITFKPLKLLDGRYVAFGRVVCGFNTLNLVGKTFLS